MLYQSVDTMMGTYANRGMAGDFTLHTLILTAMLLFTFAGSAHALGVVNLTLNAPANNLNVTTSSGDSTILFNWTTINTIGTNTSCNLTIDGAVPYSDTSFNDPANTSIQFTASILSAVGIHTWNVTCSDYNGLSTANTSGTRTYSIMEALSLSSNPSQTAATKGNLVRWDDSKTIPSSIYVDNLVNCTYNISKLAVQNNTTIADMLGNIVTNLGNYTHLNFYCNRSLDPYNITFYTEAPNETVSTVSYAGLGGVQNRFYINTTFNNSLNYSIITSASTIQGLRVWKCDQLTNISCNASGTWSEQTNYTVSGLTVNYTYDMDSNESVVIVSWDAIGGGGGLIGGGGGGGVSVLPCILPNMMVNGSCIAPAPLPGELPGIPGAAPFGQAIDGFLRGVSFGIPNAWLIIVALLFFIAEGMPRYFAGQSSGLLTVLSLFGIALIGFYYKSALGLGI